MRDLKANVKGDRLELKAVLDMAQARRFWLGGDYAFDIQVSPEGVVAIVAVPEGSPNPRGFRTPIRW